MPGKSAGTRKQEIPLEPVSPVLAIKMRQSVAPDPDMKAFDPFKIKSLPSFVAVVLKEAASEPDPGSVKQ
jgi:hypothetical protein